MNSDMPLRRKEETDVRMHDVEDEESNYVWCPFCGNQNLSNVCYCNNCNNTLIMTTSNVEGHFLRIGDQIYFCSDIIRPGHIVHIDNIQQVVTVRLSEKPWNTEHYGYCIHNTIIIIIIIITFLYHSLSQLS
jgi:hypothetical protein